MIKYLNDSPTSAAVSKTALRLRKAIKDGQISTCEAVQEYLLCSKKEQIISAMIGALNAEFPYLLAQINFTIPKDVALSWKLGKESEINVQWQCTLDRHPHAFAPLAEEDDVGKGVGVKAFKLVDGVVHEHWIVRKSREAVLLANTLYDFLT